MGDAEVDSNLPGNPSSEATSGPGDQKSGDVERNGNLNDGTTENTAPKNNSDDVALPSNLTAEATQAGDNNTAGSQLGVAGDGGDELGGTAGQGSSENDLEEGVPEDGQRKSGAVEGVHDDDLYSSVRGFALAAINAVRYHTYVRRMLR